jgi:hypothetical protein
MDERAGLALPPNHTAIIAENMYSKQTDEIKALILLLIYAALFYGTKAFHSPNSSLRDHPVMCRYHRLHQVSDANAGEPPTIDMPADRPQNVRFISPLLEYGYLPAVVEYENKTLAQKPLLLYLPGFDATFLRSVRTTIQKALYDFNRVLLFHSQNVSVHFYSFRSFTRYLTFVVW